MQNIQSCKITSSIRNDIGNIIPCSGLYGCHPNAGPEANPEFHVEIDALAVAFVYKMI
jgi:hypothetical protein